MRVVYFDQRDLIALARARAGKHGGAISQVTFDRMRQLATDGKLIGPISESHCYEIWNIANGRKRNDLSEVAILLSRRFALAPLRMIWRQELQQLLARFGATPADQPTPIGVGVLFAFGMAEHQYPADATEVIRAQAEAFFLSEPDRDGLGTDELERRKVWDEWALHQQEFAQQLAPGRHQYNNHDRAAMATLNLLGQEFHTQVLGTIPHPQDFLTAMKDEGPWSLVQELPSIGVLSELTRLKWENQEATWTRNDLHDLRYLSVALAYCDMVSVDNAWAALAQRSEFIRGLNSEIISGADTIDQMLAGL